MGLQNKGVSVYEGLDGLAIRLTEKLHSKNLKSVIIFCYTPLNTFTRDKEAIIETVLDQMVEADAIKKDAFYSHEIVIKRLDFPPPTAKLFIYRDVWGYKVARFNAKDVEGAVKQYDSDLNYIFEEIG